MARITKPITSTEIERAKAKEKDYKLIDGNGLYLLVKVNGAKYGDCVIKDLTPEKRLSSL